MIVLRAARDGVKSSIPNSSAVSVKTTIGPRFRSPTHKNVLDHVGWLITADLRRISRVPPVVMKKSPSRAVVHGPTAVLVSTLADAPTPSLERVEGNVAHRKRLSTCRIDSTRELQTNQEGTRSKETDRRGVGRTGGPGKAARIDVGLIPVVPEKVDGTSRPGGRARALEAVENAGNLTT